MKREKTNLCVDLSIFVSAFVVFVTGLVLLTRFHMGHGAMNMSAMGISRLTWLNIHRLSAAATLIGTGVHIALHWRPLISRFKLAFNPRMKNRSGSELVLYIVFPLTTIAGIAAWLIFDRTPFLGQPVPERAASMWHGLIDVHHLSGLVALVLVVHHVFQRWGWISSRLKNSFSRPRQTEQGEFNEGRRADRF